MFAAVPKTRYLVTFVGEFRCTGIGTMVSDSKGTSQGNASLSIDAGETSVMVPVKAVDTKMVATGFYPKGGEARCDIQRVEVTEIK
ncbi:hypothetical protein EON79_19000 [bacterium]|nr:MAG: hypothetical protein EON79_19000 [bacterium]